MLIADGGGGYGGTDWMSTDVRFMWSTIANQETDLHFDVVEGWRKTADLTMAHLGQVQQYRENLASVWPPNKSAASAAYLARLDKLIGDLQATHDAASANYTAFSTVTLTLSLARNKVKPILDEYEANEQLILDWKAKQTAAAQKSTSPTPTPSPSPGPSPSSQKPPVSSDRQEQLNNQARVIMYDLSSTILSGQAALKKPAPYMPTEGGSGHGGERERTNDGSNGFAVPPVIPPPGASTNASSGSTSGLGSPSHITPVPPTTSTPIGPNNGGGVGLGPVLGGINPTPVINPPANSLPVPGPVISSPTPGLTPGIIGPTGLPGLPPATGILPNSTKLPAGGQFNPGMKAGPNGRMTMPSGGVIGATPGSGMIGQMPPTVGGRPTGTGRANPVGGVIGQQGGPQPAGRGGLANRGAASTSGMPHSSSMMGSQGRGRGQRQADGEQNQWDPDNPWVTEEGVNPILLPPEAEGPIDPGPAIGYVK